MPDEPIAYLSRSQASEYLRSRGIACATSTLSKMVTVGGGPPVHHFGRTPLYLRQDLDLWIEKRMRSKWLIHSDCG